MPSQIHSDTPATERDARSIIKSQNWTEQEQNSRNALQKEGKHRVSKEVQLGLETGYNEKHGLDH